MTIKTLVMGVLLLAAGNATAEEPCRAEREAYLAATLVQGRSNAPTAAMAGRVDVTRLEFVGCVRANDAQQIKDADRAARDKPMFAMDDPAVIRTTLSVIICDAQRDKKNSLDEIQALKKSSRVGGVLDMAAVNQAQRWVRRAEERIEGARTKLRSEKLKPAACTDKLVSTIIACTYDSSALVARAQTSSSTRKSSERTTSEADTRTRPRASSCACEQLG